MAAIAQTLDHDKPPSNRFGTRLQELRRLRRLTQIDLSALSGLSKSYVSFLESGVRHPSRDAVFKLAEALAPGEAGLRDELLVLAGFMPENGPLIAPVTLPAYSREDFRSFLQHALQLIRGQDFARAEAEIDEGFQRFRRPAQMQTLLAHLELARGAFEQAILFQKTALQHYDLSPDEQDPGLTLVDFILNLGVMYFFWGDQARFAESGAPDEGRAELRKQAIARYRLALEQFDAGLAIAPDHVYLLDEAGRAHVNLADLQRGAQADAHWEASIRCFRSVLGHPQRQLLPVATLRESAAYLGMAYARRKDFHSAGLLLDTLSLDPAGDWTIPYIQACCAILAYRARPQEALLDRALAALARAVALGGDNTRAQFGLDQARDFTPLSKQRPQELEKVMRAQA